MPPGMADDFAAVAGAAAGAEEAAKPASDELDGEAHRQFQEAQRRLLGMPAEEIVANHCYGLFELAALYLSVRPPALDKARLAIDALGALAEGLENRLGAHEDELREALTNVRLAFVQMQKTPHGGNGSGDQRMQ